MTGLPQIKNFYASKNTSKKVKRQLTEGEKITNHIFDNGLVSRIYKDSYNSKIEITQFENGQRI